MAHGSLEPVLETAERAREYGCHIEVTTLLIPGLNDSPDEIEKLVEWVSLTLGRDTPLHFSRYFPNYKLILSLLPWKCWKGPGKSHSGNWIMSTWVIWERGTM